MKGLCYILALILISFKIVAQPQETDIQKMLDDWVQTQNENIDYEQVLENLLLLVNDPINLNTASAEELRAILFLTEQNIYHFMAYRENAGPLTNLYELQSIETWTTELIENILPFVKISTEIKNKNLLQRIGKEGNGYMLIRNDALLQRKNGFTTTNQEEKFKGSPIRTLIRFRKQQANDFAIGFTAEKDAGENWEWKPKQNKTGFDYTNAYLQVQNKKFIRNLIIGNFQIQTGQGLLFGNAFGLGKSGETITTVRRVTTLYKPFTSTMENAGFRGLATTLNINKNISLSIYASNINKSSSVSADSTENQTISSWRNTGLHRNEKELAGRKNSIEKSYGLTLQYENQTSVLGLQMLQTEFSTTINPDINLHNQFTFRGNRYQGASFYFSKTSGAFHVFHETAVHRKKIASNLGVVTALSNRTDWLLHFRYYNQAFISLYANPFAEGSTAQNEIGFYTGIKHQIKKKHVLAAYLDFFQFPWLRYRVYQPATGWDALFRYAYSPNKTTRLLLQYRIEIKPRNFSTEQETYKINNIQRQHIIVSFNNQPHERWRFTTRLQKSFVHTDNSSAGIVLAQDISYRHQSLAVHYRYAVFKTDTFDARHYLAERDVWSAISLPLLNGNGVRQYVLVEYKLRKWLSAQIRYATLVYTDLQESGSGIDSIIGNTRNEIKVQVVLSF
jgi:hypothetical protein